MMKSRTRTPRGLAPSILASLLLSFGLMSVSSSAYAGQGGALDSGFGIGGRVVTDLGLSVLPQDAALQPDSKIIVVGSSSTGSFVVVRYLPNGSLDSSFGKGGVVLTPFTGFNAAANAVAVQPDGKIVVVGETRAANGSIDEFALARYNGSDGSLDTGFGTGGKVTTEFFAVRLPGAREAANVVLLQSDEKILVAGSASQGAKSPAQTALARYNTNGSLDTSFGNGGKIAASAIGAANALALQFDGHILALNNIGGVAQFTSAGKLDPPATPGTILASAHIGVTAFQPNGKVILAATAADANSQDIDVHAVRFEATGSIDPTFNSPIFDFNFEGLGPQGFFANLPQAVAIESSGKIVIGGVSFPTAISHVFGVARLNANGSLDPSFGIGGKIVTSFNSNDQVIAVVVQPDNKIIAIGQTLDRTTNRSNLALARYLGQ